MSEHTIEGLMPELPEPHVLAGHWRDHTHKVDGYTAEQMREYARSYATALCQQAPATKDEALRVAREATEAYLEAQDALDNRELSGPNAEDYFTVLRRRNAARRDLDAALRTIALAVEAPRTLCPVTYCHRSIEERDTAGCDHCNHPPAPSQRDVPPGKWKVDMPDGTYCQMPGDPPGPGSVRAVINGYVYWVTPRSGKLVAVDQSRALGLPGTSNDQQEKQR